MTTGINISYLGKNYYQASLITTSQPNTITFYNVGQSAATVQPINIILQQGQSISFVGNIGELDKTQYSVTFDNTVSNQNLLVIQKVYNI